MKNFPRPTGELQGDNGSMPNRGTRTGFTGKDPMLDGRSTDRDSTNRIKGISGFTRSDPPDDTSPGDEGIRGDRD